MQSACAREQQEEEVAVSLVGARDAGVHTLLEPHHTTTLHLQKYTTARNVHLDVVLYAHAPGMAPPDP